MKNKNVCFTGHRPMNLSGYNESNPIANRIKKKLEYEILKLIDQGYVSFISGGALGVDQWAAEIVISLKDIFPKLKLIIAQPFPSQSINWPICSVKRYLKILKHADIVYSISSDPYSAYKMQLRNEWMVNNSSVIIGVWDGSPGGTANCISYARKLNKNIIIIKP